jgi:ornithine cyclodeaminase
VLVLSERDVEALLDLDALVDALAEAMVDASSGAASIPPRIAAVVPETGLLAAMPAFLPSRNVLEAKLVSLFPGNALKNLHTHQAAIVVFDAATGAPMAILDGRYITQTRTAAGSALSCRLLARKGASVAATLGTGVQARAHLRAIPRVLSLSELRVAGRDARKAEDLAAWGSEQLGLPVRAAASFEEAVAGADVVCACTHSPEPVVRRAWLAPGTHVTSVGVNPDGGEVDEDLVRDALVVVETKASALAPFPSGAADLRGPLERGVIREENLVELGDVVAGNHPGRTSDDQLTLYKSVGIGVQDAAAAGLVLAAAGERGVGARVDL